jgi:hypothetical protein
MEEDSRRSAKTQRGVHVELHPQVLIEHRKEVAYSIRIVS